MDMAGAARSVAWAQCWDNDEVLGRVKLQVHAAVGLELRKIPSELRRALQLKAKLLPAALKHLDHLHDIPAKKARQEGEGRGGEVLCVTFSLSPSLSLFSTIWSPCGGPWRPLDQESSDDLPHRSWRTA
jgi:hypothetical protein